jgi:hypothetical protein
MGPRAEGALDGAFSTHPWSSRLPCRANECNAESINVASSERPSSVKT